LLERVLQRVCELKLLSDLDVKIIQERSRKLIEETLENPVKILEIFIELLNRALALTIIRNEHTRFVWYLRKIPKKYIKEYYPELLKPEVFKFLQELLGLKEYIIPQVEDPEIVDLYTIYSFDHAIEIDGRIDGVNVYSYPQYLTGGLPIPYSTYEPYKSVGGCLCRINELIWGLFTYCKNDLKLIISGEVPDPLTYWEEAVKDVKVPPYYQFELNYPKSYEDLSMLDEWLPAIFVGRAELIVGREGKKLHLVRRW